jgi:hypothetical protein
MSIIAGILPEDGHPELPQVGNVDHCEHLTPSRSLVQETPQLCLGQYLSVDVLNNQNRSRRKGRLTAYGGLR